VKGVTAVGVLMLFAGTAHDAQSAWSPDGSRIAFRRGLTLSPGDLRVARRVTLRR